jgi:hypothetical protein
MSCAFKARAQDADFARAVGRDHKDGYAAKPLSYSVMQGDRIGIVIDHLSLMDGDMVPSKLSSLLGRRSFPPRLFSFNLPALSQGAVMSPSRQQYSLGCQSLGFSFAANFLSQFVWDLQIGHRDVPMSGSIPP